MAPKAFELLNCFWGLQLFSKITVVTEPFHLHEATRFELF